MRKELFEILWRQRSSRKWDLSESSLWYSTQRQTDGWLSLHKSSEYQENIARPELSLLARYAPEYVLDRCNIIDLGCGWGQQAAALLHELPTRDVRYCPVDVSKPMIAHALTAAKTECPTIKCRPVIETMLAFPRISAALRSRVYTHHVILLLGNTLTNFDEKRLLRAIGRGMRNDDLLLIGVILSSDINARVVTTQKAHPARTWSLGMIESIGLESEDVLEYSVITKNSSRWYYELLHDKTITCGNRRITFKAGERIRAITSSCYTQRQLRRILGGVMTIEHLWTTDGFALAVCRKS